MTTAAVVTGLIGALLLVSWLWRPRRPAERGVVALTLGYAVLGAYTLWFGFWADGEPAAFVHWKPTVLYWMLAIVVLGAPMVRAGYPARVILGTFFVFSTPAWRWINLAFGASFALLGAINLLVAFNLSEGNWDGFKYSCRVLLMFIILLRLNFVWLDLVSRIAVALYRRLKALRP